MGISLGFLLFFLSFFFIWVQRMACLCAFAFISLEEERKKEEKKIETIFASFASGYYCSIFFYKFISRPTQRNNQRGNCEENICKVHFLRAKKTRLICLLFVGN